MPEKEETITAQVVLYSSTGKSILDEQRITSGNVQGLAPDEASLRKATDELRKMGFACHLLYPTLTISGPQSLYEKAFRLTFEKKRGRLTYVQPKNKATLPPSLKNLVADLIFGEPMEPFV